MNSFYGITHDKVSAYLKATGWQNCPCKNPKAEDWSATLFNGATLHVVLLTDPADEYYSESILEAMVLIAEVNKHRDAMLKNLESELDMSAFNSRN